MSDWPHTFSLTSTFGPSCSPTRPSIEKVVLHFFSHSLVLSVDVLVFYPRVAVASKRTFEVSTKSLLQNHQLLIFSAVRTDIKNLVLHFSSKCPLECVCPARAKHDRLEAWAVRLKFGPGPKKSSLVYEVIENWKRSWMYRVGRHEEWRAIHAAMMSWSWENRVGNVIEKM